MFDLRFGPSADGRNYLQQYDPALVARFLRSQYAFNGEPETEAQYHGSAVVSGWAAARPFPNLVPFVGGARALYQLPGGPTSPKQLLQQRTVPPNFPAGDFRVYEGVERYGLPAPSAELIPAGPGGGAYPCPTPGLGYEDTAMAVAAGLKQIMPELATSIGVQTARASSQQVHTRPANLDIPIRAFEFNEANLNPVAVTDSTFVLVTEHLVPTGNISVANEIEIEAESPAGLMDTEVQIRVGGIPVPRYDSLNAPTLGSPGAPARINIKAIEDQRIQVFARARTVAAIHNLTVSLRGWDSMPSLMTNLDSVQGWRGQ